MVSLKFVLRIVTIRKFHQVVLYNSSREFAHPIFEELNQERERIQENSKIKRNKFQANKIRRNVPGMEAITLTQQMLTQTWNTGTLTVYSRERGKTDYKNIT